jgi:hypothetical protein
MEVVAAAVGVELAKQPMLLDHLGQPAKARRRALLLDDEAGINRAGRIVEGDHQVVLPIIPRQPGKARSVLVADSGDIARSFRDHVARCSDMMSPA